jgi:hypothetical protein
MCWTTVAWYVYQTTYAQNSRRCFETNYNISDLKVILHQFWVKKIFPWKFILEYVSTFTKLFMHVSNKNNCKKNLFIRHETDRFLNNHCQECVRAYLSIHDCLSFLHEVMIGNLRTKTFLHKARKSSNLVSRTYHLHYCTGKQNYLLSNILRFALKICFWAEF